MVVEVSARLPRLANLFKALQRAFPGAIRQTWYVVPYADREMFPRDRVIAVANVNDQAPRYLQCDLLLEDEWVPEHGAADDGYVGPKMEISLADTWETSSSWKKDVVGWTGGLTLLHFMQSVEAQEDTRIHIVTDSGDDLSVLGLYHAIPPQHRGLVFKRCSPEITLPSVLTFKFMPTLLQQYIGKKDIVITPDWGELRWDRVPDILPSAKRVFRTPFAEPHTWAPESLSGSKTPAYIYGTMGLPYNITGGSSIDRYKIDSSAAIEVSTEAYAKHNYDWALHSASKLLTDYHTLGLVAPQLGIPTLLVSNPGWARWENAGPRFWEALQYTSSALVGDAAKAFAALQANETKPSVYTGKELRDYLLSASTKSKECLVEIGRDFHDNRWGAVKAGSVLRLLESDVAALAARRLIKGTPFPVQTVVNNKFSVHTTVQEIQKDMPTKNPAELFPYWRARYGWHDVSDTVR